jgi:hypothetical protein
MAPARSLSTCRSPSYGPLKRFWRLFGRHCHVLVTRPHPCLVSHQPINADRIVGQPARVPASRPQLSTGTVLVLLPRIQMDPRIAHSEREDKMTIKIIPNENGNPPGQLADVELHFDAAEGAQAGLKLIGFSIGERRSGGGRNVTFPARQYSVNGERRSFALLRPLVDTTAQDRLRDLILSAYAETEVSQVVR